MASPVKLHSLFGIAWKMALLIAVLIAAKYAGNWVLGQLSLHLTPSTEPALHRLIMIAISVYVVLMTLPFVPGVEIGLGMMATFGPNIAPLVYGATVLALSLAFLTGRLVPQQTIIRAFETVRLNRTASLLKNLQTLSTEERLDFILQNSSYRITPYLVRYRFLAVMIALNIPGNAVVGGGGGICLVAGFCRLFSFPGFLVSVAIAVAPVPVLVFFTG